MKTIFTLWLILFAVVCDAQVDQFAITEAEKTELKKLTTNYLQFLNEMAKPGNPDNKKALSIKFMKESMAKGDVMTINDLDTSKSMQDIKLLVYINRLPSARTSTIINSLELISYEKMKYDKWRRFYYAEIKANKVISWKEISKQNITKVDSLTKDTVQAEKIDTLTQIKSTPVSIFVKYEKENGLSKNFRVWAITFSGKMPALPPLEPLQQWWIGLHVEWKTTLSKMRKMDECPRESDLERLTYQPELNFDKAVFKTYEPLSAFTNVKKLIISNSSIADFAPIAKMSALTYLDISKSAITSIAGIEKLTRLEELYCVGNKLTTIEPVAGITTLLKFNCSENNLDDISAVKNLVNLKELNVSLNIKLKNIDAVRELVNMEKLSFRKIEIKDLTPVQKMKNLVYLDCYNTGITSLEPIRNMQKIFHLDLSNNKVTSLEPIRQYQYLINLYLNSSSVSDIASFNNFTLLRELEISSCPQIRSLGGVHKLEYIKVLKCFYTGIDKNEIQRFKKNHPNCAITYY